MLKELSIDGCKEAVKRLSDGGFHRNVHCRNQDFVTLAEGRSLVDAHGFPRALSKKEQSTCH